MKNENIFITGGAGFLGQHLIERLHEDNHITVYSRDEAKHYYLKKQYPNVKFVIGDVGDRDHLVRSSEGHSRGIFAASLKQIEACNDNYEVAAKTIIDGAINSRIAAEENRFFSACFISSDKSRSATTIYGGMKYVAGECFIANAESSKYTTHLTTAIYGNVMNSTGSIIPLIWKSIESDRVLTLYDTEMTRFLLDIDDAVDVVMYSLNLGRSGCNVIPKLDSFRIVDIFEIYKKKFGLRYEIGFPRTGEKVHEILASEEEMRRMDTKDNKYMLLPPNGNNQDFYIPEDYSSRDHTIPKESLDKFLEKRNYYKP